MLPYSLPDLRKINPAWAHNHSRQAKYACAAASLDRWEWLGTSCLNCLFAGVGVQEGSNLFQVRQLLRVEWSARRPRECSITVVRPSAKTKFNKLSQVSVPLLSARFCDRAHLLSVEQVVPCLSPAGFGGSLYRQNREQRTAALALRFHVVLETTL